MSCSEAFQEYGPSRVQWVPPFLLLSRTVCNAEEDTNYANAVAVPGPLSQQGLCASQVPTRHLTLTLVPLPLCLLRYMHTKASMNISRWLQQHGSRRSKYICCRSFNLPAAAERDRARFSRAHTLGESVTQEVTRWVPPLPGDLALDGCGTGLHKVCQHSCRGGQRLAMLVCTWSYFSLPRCWD